MPEDNEPVVRVTLTAIYNKLLDVEDAVDPLPTKVADHEVRLRAIERYLWIWIGASGVVGAGLGQLLNSLIGGG
jgi:hypothetical protein